MEDAGELFLKECRKLFREYLAKIERCLERMSEEQIWWRPNRESNSAGNLLLHLAGNARQWIVSGLGGEADDRVREKEFAAESGIQKEELLLLLKATLDDVEAVLQSVAPGDLLSRRRIQGKDTGILEAILHVVEHFSMHTGQIIYITKLLTEHDLKFYDFQAGAPVHTWEQSKASSK